MVTDSPPDIQISLVLIQKNYISGKTEKKLMNKEKFPNNKPISDS